MSSRPPSGSIRRRKTRIGLSRFGMNDFIERLVKHRFVRRGSASVRGGLGVCWIDSGGGSSDLASGGGNCPHRGLASQTFTTLSVLLVTIRVPSRVKSRRSKGSFMTLECENLGTAHRVPDPRRPVDARSHDP